MTDKANNSRILKEYTVPYSSNSIRLSGTEWILVAIFSLALFFLAPAIWKQVEKFQPGPHYRLPYELGSDYWLYNRYSRWASSRYGTVVVGDSVVWGHYVSKDHTVSSYLDEDTSQNQFANLGVDGIHPAALQGLLTYYGRSISHKNVIVQLNPLWMSSKKHDLQTSKEFRFNHPKLVAQFTPKIPCYKASFSKRLSIAIERYIPFLSWTSHLKMVYFDNLDLPTWTMEHPYKNPLAAVLSGLPTSENSELQENASWTEKGISQQDFDWVELETSVQWSFFRQTIQLLRERGNTVFVLVGPFNEHMLKTKSYNIYQKMKRGIADWLQQNNVAYFMPPPLPSEVYRDASHPVAQGYALLAKQLIESQSFRSIILATDEDPASAP
jgi:hypothetical protein